MPFPKEYSEYRNQLISKKEVSFLRKDKAQKSYYCYLIPVTIKDDPIAVIELVEDLTVIDRHIRRMITRSTILTFVLIFTGGLVTVFFGLRKIGRPLEQLREKAKRIGVGDLSGSLQLKGHDELTELAHTINTMCAQLADSRDKIKAETEARITAMEQLRHADRLKTIGTLSSGVAHEIGTPLNVISGRAGLIASGNLSKNEIDESAEIINKQSSRITGIIQQLLKYTRQKSVERTTVDLRLLVLETIDLLHHLLEKRRIRISVADSDCSTLVTADASQIQQVLTNIIANAVHAMENNGEVKISFRIENKTHPERLNDGRREFAVVSIEDRGKGIAKENIEHIFDPFFTTKDVGEGTGLGLSIAYGIIREHSGWIAVTSKLGKGSCFLVYLPWEKIKCLKES